MRGSRAAVPKGTKSCRTQKDFCSVRPSVRPSIRPTVRPSVRPSVSFESVRADFRPERTGFWLTKLSQCRTLTVFASAGICTRTSHRTTSLEMKTTTMTMIPTHLIIAEDVDVDFPPPTSRYSAVHPRQTNLRQQTDSRKDEKRKKIINPPFSVWFLNSGL